MVVDVGVVTDGKNLSGGNFDFRVKVKVAAYMPGVCAFQPEYYSLL